MPSSFPFLDFVMKFIYIFCHCQQNTFSKNIRCATTQISAKLHILFQFTKRSFCLVLGESLRQKESVPNLLFDISEIKFIEEIRHFSENCLILHLQSGHQIIHSFRVSILDTSIEKYKNI